MGTEKLYDFNAYASRFEGTVVSVEAGDAPVIKRIVLDRTCFFPEAGGQTPDTGTLTLHAEEGDITGEVIDVSISGGVITHTVDFGASGLEADDLYEMSFVGRDIIGSIDWPHRFSNMQQHTGEHIFSGIVNSRYGYDNVGFHLSDNTVTMDYNGLLTAEQIAETEREANRIIWCNLPVNTEYPDDATLKELNYRCKGELVPPIRIVTIEGVDICACCAPHVSRTAEVGILKVISWENYKGGVRLHILCGERAFSDYSKKRDTVTRLSRVFSVPEEELVAEGERRAAERGELKHRIRIAQEERLRSAVDATDPNAVNAFIFTDDVDPDTARRYINELCAAHTGYSGAFIGRDGDYRFIIGASTVTGDGTVETERDARLALSLLKERFSCKGGGNEDMVQGSVKALKDELIKAFDTD